MADVKEKKRVKLHQLLAVESNIRSQAAKCRTDLIATFHGKRHHFEETRKIFESNAEGVAPVVEDIKDIQTSVTEEIRWIEAHMAKALDAAYMIDLGNTMAKANIVAEDGTVLLKDVPATALLQLEKRAMEVKDLIAAIPTLDPAKGFQLDLSHSRAGTYKAREVVKDRTKKEDKVIELAKATDKHPAQVAVKTYDVVVGQIREQEWSALITPATKAVLMDRAEMLFRAITEARSRANEVELEIGDNNKIGTTLLDYVFQPLLRASA